MLTLLKIVRHFFRWSPYDDTATTPHKSKPQPLDSEAQQFVTVYKDLSTPLLFHVCHQIVCPRGCKVTLAAFIWLFTQGTLISGAQQFVTAYKDFADHLSHSLMPYVSGASLTLEMTVSPCEGGPPYDGPHVRGDGCENGQLLMSEPCYGLIKLLCNTKRWWIHTIHYRANQHKLPVKHPHHQIKKSRNCLL